MVNPLGPAVLVTGANRGLGFALVTELTKIPGIEYVFAGCRDPTKADDLNELARQQDAVHVLQLDIERDDHISNAVQKVKDVLGDAGLNTLINNAAMLTETGAEYLNPDRAILEKHMSVNVVSQICVTSAFIPLLRQASSASKPSLIVNISSDCGSVQDAPVVGPAWGNIAYGITKAGVNMFTRYLGSHENYNHLVTIAVHPGWLRTDMGTSAAPLAPQEGARPLLQTLQKLTINDNGRYMDRHGRDMRF